MMDKENEPEEFSKQELMEGLKRVIKISENLSTTLVKDKEASLLKAEADLISAKSNEKLTDSFLRYSLSFERLVDYLIIKDTQK